jgi:salicylate hydroxylase
VVPIDPSEFVDQYKDWDPKLVAILNKLPKENVLEWKLCDLEPMNSWIFPGGKIVLLGDASHAMLPSAAQGAGMGIEDGAAIAELLDRVTHREQIPVILKTFENLRLPRCTYIVDSGRQNAKKWHEKDRQNAKKWHEKDAKGGTVTDEMWEYDVKGAAREISLAGA